LYKRVSNTRVEIGNAGSCRSNPAIVIRSRKKESRSSGGKKNKIKGSSINKQTQNSNKRCIVVATGELGALEKQRRGGRKKRREEEESEGS
jgi:hypothetical protein